jgi:hypothetical protein
MGIDSPRFGPKVEDVSDMSRMLLSPATFVQMNMSLLKRLCELDSKSSSVEVLSARLGTALICLLRRLELSKHMDPQTLIAGDRVR